MKLRRKSAGMLFISNFASGMLCAAQSGGLHPAAELLRGWFLIFSPPKYSKALGTPEVPGTEPA